MPQQLLPTVIESAAVRLLKLSIALLLFASVPAIGSPLLDSLGGRVVGPSEAANDAYDKGDYATALRIWRTLPEIRSPVHQRKLGFIYLEGKGTLQDYAEAARWFTRAAEQGEEIAQAALGVLYENGLGVHQDFVMAHKWLNLAASRTSEKQARDMVAEARDKLGRRMTPSQVGEAQRLAREWAPKPE